MFYDYYYKVDGELRRHSCSEVLNDEQISNLFGAKKKVLLLEPIVFEREVSTEDAAGKKVKSTEKVQVGYLGYVE